VGNVYECEIPRTVRGGSDDGDIATDSDRAGPLVEPRREGEPSDGACCTR
jgi:hypothetical protein